MGVPEAATANDCPIYGSEKLASGSCLHGYWCRENFDSFSPLPRNDGGLDNQHQKVEIWGFQRTLEAERERVCVSVESEPLVKFKFFFPLRAGGSGERGVAKIL